MPLLPNFPTDSLYKFLALFGLVILGFGLWYPDQKIREADTGIREAVRASRLAQIRLDRKAARSEKLVSELTLRSEALRKKQQPLEEVQAALDAKREALLKDLRDMLKSDRGDVEGAKKRTEALRSEATSITSAMSEFKEDLDKLHREYAPVLAQQEDLADEFKAENVNLKASLETINDLKSESEIWLNHMISSIAFGWSMIFAGFGFWFFRIQKHEDAILRLRAKSMKEAALGTTPATDKA
jgi:seryl-tRNA synthetase